MTLLKNAALFFSMIMLALLLTVLPATASAQGRGHGHGGGGIFGSSHNKCGKFVNCHDARDGRWDGRGPRQNVVWSNRSRTRNRNFISNRFSGTRTVRHDYWRHRRQ
jgi:hypothetical protein